MEQKKKRALVKADRLETRIDYLERVLYHLKGARNLCRSYDLVKKQYLASTIQLQNRCPLRQRTFHLPAAYPRIDLASLIQKDLQRFWITGRLPLVYDRRHLYTRETGHLDRFPVASSPSPLLAYSHRGEAPCALAPCRRGSHVRSPSVSGLSGLVPAICSC